MGVFVFLFAYCTFVWASGPNGQLVDVSFYVFDEDQHPVEKAQIEIRLQNQLVAHGETDQAGKINIKVLPGQYLLLVDKKNYVPNERTLEIEPSQASEIDVTLSYVGLSQQQITVQGSPTNPVTEESSVPSTLAPKQVTQDPSRPVTVKDALPLIPGVVRNFSGGIGIAGYTENNSTFLVNSVDVTDPSTGEFGLSVPIDSVETINVDEMPYLAQYGKFIAGVVATETKRGGDKWNYSLNDPLPDFRIRSGHLVGLRDMSPRLNFGGPLIADRLFISEGAEYFVYKQAVRTLPFPMNETRTRAINSFTQLDAIISPRQTLTVSFHDSPHSLKYAGLDFFNPQPVTPNADFHESTATIIDRISIGGGMLQNTLAFTHVSSAIQPQNISEMVLTPIGNQGNYFAQQSRSASRFAWMENWAPRTYHFRGQHFLQLGFDFSHCEDSGQFHARPVQIEDENEALLRRIDFNGGHAFALSDYAPALYAQDHWILNSSFAVDLGVRFEEQTITFTSRTAPRGGFVWTPGKDKKTILRGGAGIFYDAVPLSSYAFHSYPEQTLTTFDTSGGIVGLPIHYANLTEETAQSGFPLVDRGRRAGNFAPYSAAWSLEVERAVSRSLLVRLKYLQSSAHDLIALQPQFVDGKNALALGASGAAHTRQYEFTTRIGANPLKQFFFSYVRQYAQGDFNDANTYTGNFPAPVVRQDLYASMANEIPNRFLFWGTYSLPWKLGLNPHIEARNGFPYQPVNVLQQYLYLGNGAQTRFPWYFSFDLLVSKDLQVTKKHSVRISFPMTNLTNRFNPLEVHSNIADPQYGTFFGNYQRRILVDFDVLN